MDFNKFFLILLIFIEPSKVAFIKIIPTLLMSAKLATPVLLKIKIFGNKGYNVTISVHEVTNEIVSCDSNYIVDMVV